MVEFDVHNMQKIKTMVHITQMVFIVVAIVMQIVVYSKAQQISGRTGWYFGMCFLTIPAVIFLTMTVRFPRTRKFANPYALASVDFIYCIAWLSAFASQATYNSSGQCKGACGASKAVVGLGVFIWLFWIVTTFMSFYGVVYYRREGYLPGASRIPFNAQAIDPDKEAFSTAPHSDAYEPVHHADGHELPHQEALYGSGGTVNLGRSESYGGYQPPAVHDEPSGYESYSGAAPVMEDAGSARFPDARYANSGGILEDTGR